MATSGYLVPMWQHGVHERVGVRSASCWTTCTSTVSTRYPRQTGKGRGRMLRMDRVHVVRHELRVGGYLRLASHRRRRGGGGSQRLRVMAQPRTAHSLPFVYPRPSRVTKCLPSWSRAQPVTRPRGIAVSAVPRLRFRRVDEEEKHSLVLWQIEAYATVVSTPLGALEHAHRDRCELSLVSVYERLKGGHESWAQLIIRTSASWALTHHPFLDCTSHKLRDRLVCACGGPLELGLQFIGDSDG